MSKCILYGFPLNKPCKLCKCRYHINKDLYNNCMHLAILDKGNRPFRVSEIASVMGVQKINIEESLKASTDAIKIAKLDKTINVGNEIEFIENSHRCVCCSKKADIEVGSRSPNLYYCSEDCKKKLPPKLVYLIQRLGVDARTILVACVRCFSGVSIMELLEISEKELKFLYNYYFGVTITKVTNDNVELDLEYKDINFHYYKLPNTKSFIYNDDDIVKNVITSCFC